MYFTVDGDECFMNYEFNKQQKKCYNYLLIDAIPLFSESKMLIYICVILALVDQFKHIVIEGSAP